MENTEAPVSAPAPTDNVDELITRLYEKRGSIRTLIIGVVDTNGKSAVDFSSPMNAPALSHLARSVSVKLDRYYSAAMFPPQPHGPVAGVRAQDKPIPRTVRRLIKKAEKRVHKRQVKSGGQFPPVSK